MISLTNTFMLQVSKPYLFLKDKFCNCFTVPLSIDNSASLSQLSKIVGEVNLQIFLNKIIVWFDAVTFKNSSH